MKLTDNQIASFDKDYMHSGRWEEIKKILRDNFGDKEFKFLDIGGGNGNFTDRILSQFKNSYGMVIDNSFSLIKKNIRRERKNVILCNAEEICNTIKNESFDIIFFNWVLHHLVKKEYNASLKNIKNVLLSTKFLLVNGGLVSIYENCYESYSSEELPSKLIFYGLTNKLTVPILRNMGANTAGVGVCYLSVPLWEKIFDSIGFELISCTKTDEHRIKKIAKWFLLYKRLNVNNFLLRKI